MKNLSKIPNGRTLTNYGGKGRTRIMNSCGNKNGTCSEMTMLPMCIAGDTPSAAKGKKKGKGC